MTDREKRIYHRCRFPNETNHEPIKAASVEQAAEMMSCKECGRMLTNSFLPELNCKCLPTSEYPDDEDLCYNDDIVCPYCGFKQEDSYERPSDEGADDEAECDLCGRIFRFTTHVSVTYTSRRMETA